MLERHGLGPTGRTRGELHERGPVVGRDDGAAAGSLRHDRGVEDRISPKRSAAAAVVSTTSTPAVSISRSSSEAGTRGFSGTTVPPARHTANHAAIAIAVLGIDTPVRAPARPWATSGSRIRSTRASSSPRVVTSPPAWTMASPAVVGCSSSRTASDRVFAITKL